LKIVQIGTGGWGKNHCRVLSELGVLSAVCDKDLHLAEEFGKKYSVNFYNSLETLLEKEEFDAAFICTPTITHAAIAIKLSREKIKLGLHYTATNALNVKSVRNATNGTELFK
jgi:UDP-N-acetylglucosamine 3-dehydrogenase